MIVNSSGLIDKNIFLVDTLQYGIQRITACYIYWDGTDCILMDVGTSDNVTNLYQFIRKEKIPLSKVRGIVVTHFHFDHGGGALNLWRRLQPKNPEFKIFVPQDTHDKLQNSEEHLGAAKTTFGDFIGTMNPVPEEAFQIVDKNVDLPFKLQNNLSLRLLSTPGHCPDHVSPTVFHQGKPIFCYAGEAAGAIFHSKKLVSIPTSMPSNFHYETYIKSLHKIKQLNVETMGLCHDGGIKGASDINEFLTEHELYLERWRSKIRELYAKEASVRYVIDNTNEFWLDRIDFGDTNNKFFQNLRLALTYGMMIDMGLRPPKYEKRRV